MVKTFGRLFVALLPWFLLPGLPLPLAGQNYQFTYYTGNDGLPTDLTKAAAITPDGFVCMATDEGFVVYDGQNFTTYRDELYSRYAKYVFTTPDNRVLISDDMGLTSVDFNGLTPNFIRIKSGDVNRTDSLLWYPKLIYADARSNLWVTDNKGISKLKGNRLVPLPLEMKELPGNVQRSFMLADDSVGNLFAFYDGGNSYLINADNNSVRETTGILPDQNFFFAGPKCRGEIWVAGTSGLWILRTKEHALTPQKELIVAGIEFSYLIKLQNNHFLGATWTNGLYEIKQTTSGYTCTKIEDFSYGNANHLTMDHEGNVWITSDNGLVLMTRRPFEQPFPATVQGYIQHIQPYQEGVLITDGKKIIYAWHKAKVFGNQHIYTHQGASTIIRLLPVATGIWMADNQGNTGFIHSNGKTEWFNTRQSGAIFILAAGKDDEVWFCQDGRPGIGVMDTKGALRFLGKEAGISSRIISITTAHDRQHLYLGGSTDEGFLFKFDLNTFKAQNMSKRVDFQHNIPIAVNDIAVEGHVIWLATSFGLLKHDGAAIHRADLGRVTESTIKGITIDKNGTPWVTASTGIVKIEKGECFVFAEREGLPSKTASYRSIVTDANNQIWSGTISGVAFSPNSCPAIKIKSPILITSEINGQAFDWKPNDEMVFNNRSFLRISTATPAFPGKLVLHQYRLISNSDTSEWHDCGFQVEHHLNTWAKGSHVIQVRVRKEGNFTWSDPLVLHVKVTRIWYETPWKMAGLIVAGLLIIWLIMKYNNSRHKVRQIRLEEEIEKRVSEIRSQKNFIENQKNAILTQNHELERKNIELTEARHKAEEHAKSRTMFLSTMSHELRTPLNAVIGMTYILLNEDPRPNQVDNLQTLRFSAENLLALINDILDFSKIEAGKLSFEDVDFDLYEKISNIAHVLRVKADEKAITIVEKIGEGVPQFLVGDSTRLNQILFNLVGNAVKFTPAGSVNIGVEQFDETPTHHTLRITITDTGIGIANDKIDAIFDSFTQAENDTTRKYGGTGLGLAITKKLIELQGGRIQVKSTLGKGTSFIVEMTYRKSEKNQRIDEPIFFDEFCQFNKEKILVVDDNQINLIVARKFLSKWNLIVETAENGVEAYELARTHEYRMILMDIQMPEMDGYTATRAIRQFEIQLNRSPIPIIALTASALLDVKEKIFSSGMNDFITKPFNPKELNYKIGKILQNF